MNRNAHRPADRAACYGQLMVWWTTDGHLGDVVRDVAQTIDPRLYRGLRARKRAVLGSSRKAPPGSLPSSEAGPIVSAER